MSLELRSINLNDVLPSLRFVDPVFDLARRGIGRACPAGQWARGGRHRRDLLQDTVSGLALGGFDPVTILPEGPQPGRADLQLV